MTYIYRETVQGFLEQRILQSLFQGKKPTYYGCIDDEDKTNKVSFFNDILPTGVYLERELKMQTGIEYFGLTKFPLILALNINKGYKLSNSGCGEGIKVNGEIDINDLEIVYSLYENNLDKYYSGNLPLRLIQNDINQLIEKFELKREGIFERDPEELLPMLNLLKNGITLNQKKINYKPIKKALKRLERFLKPELRLNKKL
ncbi:MAG: hypothetical protein PHF86_09985 [Candidatus Nanoarchaeia archaeon]|nr:hypothetical protein [Candidatus Nanoarchaeia archaeon]